jgi:hypothetical protein
MTQTNFDAMKSDDEITTILRRARVEVAPESFYLVSLTDQHWRRVLENPELAPRADAQFMILRDKHEVTLLLEEDDWRALRHAAREARVEGAFRLLTFDVELDWNTIGFLARVSDILAQADVAIGALTAFSRDHLLIKQDDLPRALRALGAHVAELC